MLQRPRPHYCALSQAVCYAPCRAPYHRAGCRVALPLSCIVALPPAMWRLSHETTSRPICLLVMIQFIVSRHTTQAVRPSRAQLVLPREPAVSQAESSAVSWPSQAVSWPRLAVSWPLQLCPVALCHDTIHCIVTQMGNSPSSLCFFFFSPFFFSFQLLENHQKKYLFIFFIFQ